MFKLNRMAARLICSALFTAGLVVRAARDEEFKQVDPRELTKNPQKYWAQGLIFKDTLVTPPAGNPVEMGDRSVIAFRTKLAGECYADAVLIPALNDLKPGAECIFSGTVFQESGWFSSKFFIAVQEFTTSAGQLPALTAKLRTLQSYGSNISYSVTAQRLDQVLSFIQTELMAYSSSQNIPLSTILDPASEHKNHVTDVVRRSISRLEEDTRMPSSAFLVDLLTAMTAQHYFAPSNNVEAISVEENKPQTKPDAPAKPEAKEEPKAGSPPLVNGNVDAAEPIATNAPVPAKTSRSFFVRIFESGDSKPKQAVEAGAEAKKEEVKDESAKAALPEKEPLTPPAVAAKTELPPGTEQRPQPEKKPWFIARMFGFGHKKATPLKTPTEITPSVLPAPSPAGDQAAPAR